MRRRKKYEHKPMLYIQQPSLEQPSASMQADYRTPKKKKVEKQENKDVPKHSKLKRVLPKSRPVEKKEKDVVLGDEEVVAEELAENQLEEVEESSDEKEPSGEAFARKKRFGDMSIEEKVNYFVGLPTHVPKMKCEVRTEEERLIGVITDYKDGLVHMASVKRPNNREININEIKRIRLLGF
ncbi:CotO family spore coat protein [Aquibacillus kalidii]|uniref:CotO family spore coat protein n=1 Tax=Aquibacillus kalidii TaxID=2762597 RepID=UPI001645A416|nr:CotO family spore coat protein [Aquibacillus kalidii]